MATMKEIAEKAGVNISTVSRALNQHSSISQETQEYIAQVAKELGYSNRRIRSMANKTIALIIPELDNQYYIDITHMIKNKLEAKGYTVIFAIGGYPFVEICDAITRIKKLDISGIIVVSSGSETNFARLLNLLSDTHSVLISEVSHLIPIDSIFIDQQYIMKLIACHLYESGYRKIAYLGESLSDIRLKYLKKACVEHGLLLSEKMIFDGKERFTEGGYLRAKELLQQKELPDAVVASYDRIAIGAMQAFREENISIPQDIALIGIDNERLLSYISPRLTSVNTPVEQMCEIAIKLLTEQIEVPQEHIVQHVSLQSKLIVRDSTSNPTHTKD